jgi:mannose-6-phosphate isomerase-like protein (cupin superfamily)
MTFDRQEQQMTADDEDKTTNPPRPSSAQGGRVHGEDAPRSRQALLSNASQSHSVWFGANRITILATGIDTAGGFGSFLSWAPPGSSPPLHLHHGVDESFYVLEGRVRVLCGEVESTLAAGDFVLLPREIPHSFIIEGDEDARMLGLLSPGGSERYFVEAGITPAGPGLPPDPGGVERMISLAGRYGIEILGPPMT